MIYGVLRLLEDLSVLNYAGLTIIQDSEGKEYVMFSQYEVQIGVFTGRVIDLAIPATPDFPRTVGSSIHIRSTPQLLEKQNIPGKRNIIDSKLGIDWRYWSFQFTATETETAKNLMEQVNGVFRNI